jgi:hypothetical protein
MGRRHRLKFVSSSLMIGDMYLGALRDVDRGRQARHKSDLKALHRLVLVASDVIVFRSLAPCPSSLGRRQMSLARLDASI